MKIFITGASGFIGSHLVPRLQQNYQVHAMTSDLMDFNSVAQELQQVSPDVLVHLAARTEVEKSFYEQISFSQVNYVGTVNLIEQSKKLPRLKNFVFASTMEVYGWQPISDSVKKNHNFIPEVFDEHTEPQPNAPYAVAKHACEQYLEYMHRSQDFPFTVIRQTNSYGRKDNDFFVTEQIISQMIRNPDNVYLGNWQPFRNFIYIDDLIDAWTTVISNPLKCQGKVFTLGPNNPVQIKSYADCIAKKLGWHGIIHWHTKPNRPGEIYWLNSSNDLITNTLNWQPRVSLDYGLDKTIAQWQERLGTCHKLAV